MNIMPKILNYSHINKYKGTNLFNILEQAHLEIDTK